MKLKSVIYLAILSNITLTVAADEIKIPTISCPASVADIVHVLKDRSFQGLAYCGDDLNRSCYNTNSFKGDYNRGDRETKLSAVYFRNSRQGHLLTCEYDLRDPLRFYIKILPGGACQLKENGRTVEVCTPENLDSCHLECSKPLTIQSRLPAAARPEGTRSSSQRYVPSYDPDDLPTVI